MVVDVLCQQKQSGIACRCSLHRNENSRVHPVSGNGGCMGNCRAVVIVLGSSLLDCNLSVYFRKGNVRAYSSNHVTQAEVHQRKRGREVSNWFGKWDEKKQSCPEWFRDGVHHGREQWFDPRSAGPC